MTYRRVHQVVTDKTLFFVIGPFCTHHSICPNIFWYGSLYGNDAFSILVLSTKNWYSSFLKKVFVFQIFYFKVKVLKMLKISTDCHIKTCWSLKQRPILKIFFRRTYVISVGFKMKPLKKKLFPVLRQKPTLL